MQGVRHQELDYQLLAPSLQLPIDEQPFQNWQLPDGTRWLEFYHRPSGYLLRFPSLADFSVSGDGSQIICQPAPDITTSVLEHLYLNQVQPLALSRRGKLVFHASGVVVGNHVIAFLADSGRGKSTLATEFATNGYSFVTDDGLALEPFGEQYRVSPSHPSIRLWSDSQKALEMPDTLKLPCLHYTPKSRFVAGGNIQFCGEMKELWGVFFLGDGTATTTTFRRTSPSESVLGWVKNSFLLDCDDQALLRSHFDRVTQLVKRVPCYALDYPRRFEGLAKLREEIIHYSASEGLPL